MRKVAVVTGATSGIGKACVKKLLEAKVDVIALSRQASKGEQLIEACQSLTQDAKLHIILGELGDNTHAHQTSLAIAKLLDEAYEGRLDILMNIAGGVNSGYHENEDGNEQTFATNHLSVFILTYHMTPYLRKSVDPRVLVVSSLSHYRASINWKNIQNKKFYNILKAYKRSKLYNVFFVKAYAAYIKEIPIYAIDPGLVKTEIGLKNTSKLAAWVWKLRVSGGDEAITPATHMVQIALSPAYKELSGSYIKHGKVMKSNPITYDFEHARKLWTYSENCTNINYQTVIQSQETK